MALRLAAMPSCSVVMSRRIKTAQAFAAPLLGHQLLRRAYAALQHDHVRAANTCEGCYGDSGSYAEPGIRADGSGRLGSRLMTSGTVTHGPQMGAAC